MRGWLGVGGCVLLHTPLWPRQEQIAVDPDASRRKKLSKRRHLGMSRCSVYTHLYDVKVYDVKVYDVKGVLFVPLR
jgi:hypothetical protein